MGLSLPAEESVKQKAKALATEAGEGLKDGLEVVENKTCELINGKTKCVVKKIKRKMTK